MGVFFNEPAITFDQAPYSAILSDTVRSEVVYKPYEVLLNRLESDGYTHEELQVLVPSLLSYTPFDAAERSKLVTNTYLEGRDDGLVTVKPLLDRVDDVAEFLGMEADPTLEAALTKGQSIGRPLMSDAALMDLEQRLVRPLRPRKRGRPVSPNNHSRLQK